MRMPPAAVVLAFFLRLSIARAQMPAQARLPPPTPEQIRAAAAMPFRNPALPIEQRVDDLVGRMTLDEKVSQLIDRAAAIPHLDVPASNWWNEGLHGIARSGCATVFPQAIRNAATWDAPLVNRMATVVSTEARAKYNDAIRHDNHDRYYGLTIWSPNINIFRDKGKPLYGFGDGLSYTSCTYSNIKLSSANVRGGDALNVEADITDAGAITGDEVAELYLAPPRNAVSPRLELAGSKRLHLNPGETRHVSFHLDPRTLSQVDDKGVRAVVPGKYRVFLGGSQPDGDAAQGVLHSDFLISGKQELPR